MEELQVKRGPGRPPKYHEKVAEQAVPASAVQHEPPRQRPNRKPFGSLEQKLAYPARDGFHRHWFNDVPGRIQRAQEAGYEHVKDKEDKNVCKVVGTAEGGGPLHAYLMEIPEEWHQEDMAAQQQHIDEVEATIKRGEFESKEGDGRYVPAQGISITHGR